MSYTVNKYRLYFPNDFKWLSCFIYISKILLIYFCDLHI